MNYTYCSPNQLRLHIAVIEDENVTLRREIADLKCVVGKRDRGLERLRQQLSDARTEIASRFWLQAWTRMRTTNLANLPHAQDDYAAECFESVARQLATRNHERSETPHT